MSVIFDKAATVHGMPVARYRDILSRWEETLSVTALTKARKLGLVEDGPHRAACIVDDAEARGLFGPVGEGYGPTESGKALLSASSRPPIPAAAGHEIVSQLLDRMAAANADPTYPERICQVWLLGSLAKGSAAVNDVDLVYTQDWKPGLDEDEHDRMLLAYAVANGLADGTAERSSLAVLEHKADLHALHGGRIHPRLQFLTHEGRLVAMAEPCRLLFDVDRGGRVDDPLLPHHPRSTGRHPDFAPPRTMPDLSTPPPMGPLSARVALYLACETAPEPIAKAVGRIELIADDQGHRNPVEDWARSMGSLDPWNRFCLVGSNEGGHGPVVLFLERIVEDDAKPVLVIDGLYFPSHVRPDAEAAEAMAHVLATLVTCDAEKVRFRTGVEDNVSVEISCTVEDDWLGGLRDMVQARLGPNCELTETEDCPRP